MNAHSNDARKAISSSLTASGIESQLLHELLTCTNTEFSTAQYLNLALARPKSGHDIADEKVDDGDRGNQDLTSKAEENTSADNHNNNNNNNGGGEDDNDEAQEEISQRVMAELALSLQMQTQSCHDEIGRIGAELRAILPRCSADLSRLKISMDNLKEDARALLESHVDQSSTNAHHVGAETEDFGSARNQGLEENDRNADNHFDPNNNSSIHPGVDSDDDSNRVGHKDDDNDDDDDDDDDDFNNIQTLSHSSALETLSTLHALKHNLYNAKQVLVAASTYNQTLAKIPSLLSPSTLNQCVQAWMELEQGAKALSGMPGKAQRESNIQNIRQEILTLLKPVLLHALSKVESRLGPLQTCVTLYQSLGQVSSLMDEYVKIRPSAVHKLWFDFRKVQSNNDSSRHDGTGSTARGNMIDEEGKDLDELEIADLSSFSEISNQRQEKEDGAEFSNMNDPSASFVRWLPTWYDAVLMLLSEERRRANAVFGAELAPEVMIKVLNECFRPISSSFEKRLAVICPIEDKGGMKQATAYGEDVAFDAICRAYESTLQFLSVAYEQMVDFDINSSAVERLDATAFMDESSCRKTPVQLYEMVRNTFVAIASPFTSHLTNFATLESNHTGLLLRLISTDIQSAVSGRFSTLSNLQESVEKLSSLAVSVFPLVQDSITRYELLNCGFGASQALDTVDSVLSRHIGELSISIDTLLTNVSSADNYFDEQQVQCALDVLKIAGEMRKNVEMFHARARDRLSGLVGRVEAAMEQNLALSEAVKKRLNFNSALVPDSLSAADIKVILAIAICGGNGNSSAEVVSSKLADDDGGCLIPKSFDALNRLIKGSQAFVFDICSALPLQYINQMNSFSVWGEEASISSDLNSDPYGTLPQSYITQVGEHLLALVQALEPFASDKNALNVANLVMEGIEHVTLKYWRDFAHAIDAEELDCDNVAHFLRKGERVKNLVLNMTHDNAVEDEGTLMDDDELEAQEFCNKWLDVICSSVTGVLLESLMRIQYLSRKGCEHLSIDLNYIVNVLTALGVTGHPHPLLIHTLELSKLSVDDLKSHILTIPDDGLGLRNIERRFLQIRGSRDSQKS